MKKEYINTFDNKPCQNEKYLTWHGYVKCQIKWGFGEDNMNSKIATVKWWQLLHSVLSHQSLPICWLSNKQIKITIANGKCKNKISQSDFKVRNMWCLCRCFYLISESVIKKTKLSKFRQKEISSIIGPGSEVKSIWFCNHTMDTIIFCRQKRNLVQFLSCIL